VFWTVCDNWQSAVQDVQNEARVSTYARGWQSATGGVVMRDGEVAICRSAAVAAVPVLFTNPEQRILAAQWAGQRADCEVAVCQSLTCGLAGVHHAARPPAGRSPAGGSAAGCQPSERTPLERQ